MFNEEKRAAYQKRLTTLGASQKPHICAQTTIGGLVGEPGEKKPIKNSNHRAQIAFN